MDETERVVAEYRIRHSPGQASYLVLPGAAVLEMLESRSGGGAFASVRAALSMPLDMSRYPVLYVTDMSVPMDAISGAMSRIAMAGEIPHVIVVGIGYPVDDFSKSMAVRSKDLTPVADPARRAG
ncbi:MAG: hypothetical protein HKO53_00165 [Gemmatimonadetes bacterium]|nr:hypothetical protein [Gemmatimonadota bacterium]